MRTLRRALARWLVGRRLRRRPRQLAAIRRGCLRHGLDLWDVADSRLLAAIERVGRLDDELCSGPDEATESIARCLGMSADRSAG